MKITDIKGIEQVHANKLNKIGVVTIEDLLVHGASKSGRMELTEKTGIDEARILTWVNMADLFRIKGVGSKFAELLHTAGVDTIKELRTRNAENLHAKLVEIQKEKKITHTVPGLSQITDYINQSKDMDPVISY